MRVAPSLAAVLLGLAAPAAVTPILAQAPVAAPAAAPAPAGQRVITQDVYDLWRSIQGAALSDDGRWLAYSVTPAVGDGELVVRATSGATEFRVPRGWLGRPVTSVTGGGAQPLPAARISADSRWVAALVYAPMAEFERARRAGRRAPQPRPTLALLALPGGEVTRVPNVRSFELPGENGRWIAYLLEPTDTTGGRDTTTAAAPNVAAAAPGAAPRPVAGDSGAARAPRKETGSTLVLRDLAAGTETRIENVTEYVFDEAGRRLGYTVSTRDGVRDGAYVRDLEAGREIALHTGRGNYKQLAFDEAGTQAAFVSDVAEFGRPRARYALYHASLRDGRAAPVVAAGSLGGEVVSDRADVRFVPSGAAVQFGIAPAPLDSIPADSLADKAVFDLWHYEDARLQPQQIVEAGRDRNRSYAAVWHVGPRRLVRLGSDSLPSVTITDDARTALAVTDIPYALEALWGEGGSDLWLIDARTGDRRVVARNVDGRAQLSPGGKFVVWFDSSRWWSHDVAAARTVDLTGSIANVRFDQETWDTPSTPAPWGVGGWTEGDARVLVHDRFDVWELDPAGRAPARALTDGVGRRGGLVFRVVNLAERQGEGDEPLDPSQPLLLSAMDTATKAHGFWEDRVGGAEPPRRIVMANREFGTPRRSEDGSTWMVTQETVREFPDLWVGPSLTQLTKVSDANPQQSQYRWADAELVSWRSLDGRPLQGLLYKPDGFDPAKRYPMVVYFYEEHSDNLHAYVAPAGRNVVNPITYASHGYLVFFPDIAYEEGYPGRSALQSIVPGVNALVARGIVDPKAVGVAGQSWGGYQAAYMVTQTNVFAAAVANAPVANMTSAYGGIRWESGRARAFQYEKTQSRIGGSIWEYPLRYIENSPLFYADQVETPLLMMHNDGDGAVPWYQGIEMFVALRRFGKEVYLVNYNGDAHNPRKRANQKDIDMRMLQFFAHHLKGEPMPDWMRRGIPFLEKGRDQIANTAEPAPTGTTAQPGTVPGGQPPR